MRRLALLALMMLILGATPALGADEPEDRPPRTGGPILTIPIDTDEVKELVIADVVLDPTAGLAAGDRIRIIGRIAGGTAPPRTIVAIDGIGEIDGDVPVAADGAIDHEIELPRELPPGQYNLVLLAGGLGAAPLGVFEVIESVPAAASDPVPATTAAPAPTTQPDAVASAPPAASDSSQPGLMLILVALGAAAVIVLVVLGRRRRRGTPAPAIGHAAPLPTATRAPNRAAASPSSGEASRPGVERSTPNVAAPVPPAAPEPVRPPVGDDGTTPAPSTAALEPVETGVDRVPATNGTRPAEPATEADVSQGTPVEVEIDAEAAYVVVEVTAGVEGGSADSCERVVAGFADIDAAKEAARRARATSTLQPDQEAWWEVRPVDSSAVWMVHAWAPREYDIRTATDDSAGASLP